MTLGKLTECGCIPPDLHPPVVARLWSHKIAYDLSEFTEAVHKIWRLLGHLAQRSVSVT